MIKIKGNGCIFEVFICIRDEGDILNLKTVDISIVCCNALVKMKFSYSDFDTYLQVKRPTDKNCSESEH